MGAPTQREYWSGKTGDDWAGHAEPIDAMLAPLTEAALAFAAFAPGERVLDIGCGNGATSLEIARRVGAAGAVTGVDLAPQMLEVARNRARRAGLNIDFREADAGADDLGPSYDAAFSRFGIMFFEAPAIAFAHIRASLRDNGRLVFACWRGIEENAWATAPLDAIRPMLKATPPPIDPDLPGPYSLADRQKIERVLSDAGWRGVDVRPWDGLVSVGGDASLADTIEFVLKIGPCARLLKEQELDLGEARLRLEQALAPFAGAYGVRLPGACWLVKADA